MAPLDLTYDQILGGEFSKVEIQQLAEGGHLTKGTLDRIAHLGRFLQRIGSLAAAYGTDAKVSDHLTEDDLQVAWKETDEAGDDSGPCPMIGRMH